MLLILGLSLSGCERGPGEIQIVQMDSEAPLFSLKGLDGKTYSLVDFRGRVVVIEFWATWCHACKETAPVLEALYESYKDRGLIVIGITMDSGYGAEENVREFVKRHNQTYPILWDDDRVSRAYQAIQIPLTYVLDRDLIVRKKIVGYTSEYQQILEETIKELL